jgi:hypothetical protein
MGYYRFIYFIFIILLTSACQSISLLSQSNHIPLREDLFNDPAFPYYMQTQIETVQQIFNLENDIKEIVATRIATVKNPKKRAKKLLNQIFKNRGGGIVYLDLVD